MITSYVRAAASQARGMAVDVAKNQERGCTDGPVVSLEVLGSRPGNAGAKSTLKPPARADQDEGAPKNAENRLAKQCCATHSRHPSHQRPHLAVYKRDRPTSADHFWNPRRFFFEALKITPILEKNTPLLFLCGGCTQTCTKRFTYFKKKYSISIFVRGLYPNLYRRAVHILKKILHLYICAGFVPIILPQKSNLRSAWHCIHHIRSVTQI